jgi:hypothetical protein
MYNIVYSITFHQSIEFVNHFLKNIEKYNKENNYLIIIHLSDKLYNQKDNLYKKNVMINPIHYNKKLFTHLLMKPFFENFEYLISQNICFDNFMTLTSSNRLVRQAPKFVLQNINKLKGVSEPPEALDKFLNCPDQPWHWPAFLKNKDILKIFQDNKMKIIGGQVSGRLYSKNIMEKICKFIRVNKIMELIKEELCFEEIILPTLANYYMNTNQLVYCHTFWNKPSSIPNVNEVKQILNEKPHIFIIKRFPEDLNHILYKTAFS